MIKEILKKRSNHNRLVNSNSLHLSIQLSLDGFSFCIHNREGKLVNATSYTFIERSSTPEDLLTYTKQIFNKDKNLHSNFENIQVIHQNELNTLVPDVHFSETHLKDYLNYSIKTFSSDYITFDDLVDMNAKNVFIPFVNINNYLLDHFGDFHFYHHQTILIQKSIRQSKGSQGVQCFAHVSHTLLDILVIEDDKLLLANTFEINSPEDFIYYILFVYEQLQLDTNEVELKLIGGLTNESEFYKLAYKYIKEVNLVAPTENLIVSSKEFVGNEFHLLA